MQTLRTMLPVPQRGPERRLVFSAFANNLGGGLQEIVIPFYLIRHGGLGITEVGVLLAVVGIGSLLAVAPAGFLCDRRDSTRIIVSVGIAQALVTVILVLTSQPVVVAGVLLVCTLLSQMARMARVTIVAGLGPDRRTVVRGQMAVWSNLGIALGMLLTVPVLASGELWAYQAAFAVNALSFLVSSFLRRGLHADRIAVTASPTTLTQAMDVVRSPGMARLSALHAVLFLHQVVLTLGVSLWAASRPEVPDYIVGVMLTLNLVIAVLFQGQVAAGVSSAVQAVRAWVACSALSAVAVALFATGIVVRTPSAVATGIVVTSVVLLSAAELYYTAGEMEMSMIFASDDALGTSQAAFGIGRDVALVVGPALLAALTASRNVVGWVGLTVLIASVAVVVPRVTRRQLAAIPEGISTR